MLWLWTALASAAPFQMLQPAYTMPQAETEMGGSVGYIAAIDAIDQGNPLISGWGRYGLADRVEVGGGAYMPLSPFDLVIHAGVRGTVLGPLEGDGPHLSVGASVGTQVKSVKYPQIQVPVILGYRLRTADLFVGPTVGALSSLAGAIGQWSVEGGAAIKTSSFPVYIAASYGQIGGFDIIGANVGLGYNMKM